LFHDRRRVLYDGRMATLVRPAEVMIEDVSWELYDHFLRDMGHGATRMVYDDGRLEIMTVLPEHEEIKKAAARLLEYWAVEAGWPLVGFGNVTLRRRDLRIGLEPDECYYIVTPRPRSTKGELDLLSNSPPDLALEIEVTQSSIGKVSIYAQIGVREIWRWTAQGFLVLERDADGQYQQRDQSRLLPDLNLATLSELTLLAIKDGQPTALAVLRGRLRGES
jgi:Uma2 family endonuclease